jgi:hypothetical protein
VTLLNERPGAGAVAGLLLILAGSYLSTGGKLPPAVAERARRARAARGPERPPEAQVDVHASVGARVT